MKSFAADIRLVVTDMDGTLLDENHEIPKQFWPLLQRLHAAGIRFAPASGRQLYTLLEQFQAADIPLSIIAENGTMVYHDGAVISTTTLNPADVHAVIDVIDAHTDIDWGIALCRTDGAFISRTDEAFVTEGARYYARLTQVEDLHTAVNDEVIKIALYSFEDVSLRAESLLTGISDAMTVTVSGKHWIDMMNPVANKGAALRDLAQAMGIKLEQTLAFGDFLNDYELLETAGTSYAMANAHPQLLELADHIAPSNAEHGVLKVLEQLLAQ
ncbi:HAD family hydrolase [Corynebacterium sp. HS2168-gen11]|uniref:HAD family hydrolase n=1 Tax=Corynebacterium sp. HS2168-gen11 TaxID=2974027 RepID=UPI00216B0C7A|nr:HAD family hydrolase [Corynebacterium sp. HS2168-gen11]MCS4536361.1 Cof-type HAD-IIB family hydrolase [Corynebacterium sp. HS2168-gen11]